MRSPGRTAIVLVATLVGVATWAVALPTAQAATFVVDTLSDDPADGDTLREAIALANGAAGPDVITFAPGVSGTIVLESGQLDIQDSVTIVGPGSDQLTIDAGGSSRVMSTFTPLVDLRLEGLTLTNGATPADGGALAVQDGNDVDLEDLVITASSSTGSGGGAWFNSLSGRLDARGLEIIGNTAGGNGGGIFVDGTGANGVVLDGVTITDNSAAGSGGGAWLLATGAVQSREIEVVGNQAAGPFVGGYYAQGTFVSLEDSAIDANTSAGSHGGVLLIATSANAVLTGVAVTDNTAATLGGGGEVVSELNFTFVSGSEVTGNQAADVGGLRIGSPTGTAQLRDSIVAGNTATNLVGGVLVNDTNALVVERTQIADNTATRAAGIRIDTTTTATIDRTTISGNVAATSGGGLSAEGVTPLRVVNSTVSGNSAGTSGGGFELIDGNIGVRHSTVTANTAATGGGLAPSGATTIDLEHTIVAGNSATTGPDVAGTATTDFSLIGNASGATLIGADNLVGVDAGLLTLADNGGPTPTHLPAWSSPALDAGDPGIAVPPAPDVDQRELDRIVDVIDIGAVERNADDPLPVWLPVEPARIMDTRPGFDTVDGIGEGGGPISGGTQRTLDVAGRAGIPGDALAVIANVTAVEPVDRSFVTVHPCELTLPVASSLNSAAGMNVGNELIAGLDATGGLCLYVHETAHLTVDVVGYVPAFSPYETLEPARYLDTRPGFTTFDGEFQGSGRRPAGSTIVLDIAGRATIPAGADAVVMNVTAVDSPAPGFVTVHPCAPTLPVASSLNHTTGINRGNEIVAPLSANGRVCIYTHRAIHLTVDVVGFLPAGTDFAPLAAPARLLDTRPGLPTVDGAAAGGGIRPAGSTIALQIAGRAGVPHDATTVTMNVTAVGALKRGFVTAYPCALTLPVASSLNYVVGVSGGNDLVAALDDDGKVCLYTHTTTHLTVDVSGATTL
jgi:hypothetical protein